MASPRAFGLGIVGGRIGYDGVYSREQVFSVTSTKGLYNISFSDREEGLALTETPHGMDNKALQGVVVCELSGWFQYKTGNEDSNAHNT